MPLPPPFPRVILNGFTRPFFIDQNAQRDISFDFLAPRPNSTNIYGPTLFSRPFLFVSFPQFPPMWSTGQGTGLRGEESGSVCHSPFFDSGGSLRRSQPGKESPAPLAKPWGRPRTARETQDPLRFHPRGCVFVNQTWLQPLRS